MGDGRYLMFADWTGWNRPIRFRGGVGGHASACQTAEGARGHRVRRPVFAHLGRATVRALGAGQLPAFGEVGREGGVYLL